MGVTLAIERIAQRRGVNVFAMPRKLNICPGYVGANVPTTDKEKGVLAIPGCAPVTLT